MDGLRLWDDCDVTQRPKGSCDDRKTPNGPTHNISLLPPLSFDQHTLLFTYKNVASVGSSFVSSPLLVVLYFPFFSQFHLLHHQVL